MVGVEASVSTLNIFFTIKIFKTMGKQIINSEEFRAKWLQADIISNFIEFYSSDDAEREAMKSVMDTFIDEESDWEWISEFLN